MFKPPNPHNSFTDAILESISDGVFTVDKNWRITSFNRAAEKITGVSKKEAIGSYCSDVFRSNLCGVACALRQTLETGKPIIDKSGYFINADGEKVPISISTAVLYNESGEVIGGAETFRDLSEIESLHKELKKNYKFGDIISQSPKMQKIFDIIPAIAESPSTVLILGETGTGKELVARSIHAHSSRKKKPFIALNCGALPDSLLESELFGYKAGAFTGANKDKLGKFDLAKGGTLFLDEIGEVSQALQVRLLRVLQERVFEPLGGVESRKADVRIVAATNRNLIDMISEGSFREDLYYRINVARIELPPLRERKEDIPLLVQSFIDKFNILMKKSIEDITPEAISILMSHDWKGNIRELENTIERSFITCNTQYIDTIHLPDELKIKVFEKPNNDIKLIHKTLDIHTIETALKRNNYNRLATARDLNIHKTTLFRKIKSLGITLPKKDGRYKK